MDLNILCHIPIERKDNYLRVIPEILFAFLLDLSALLLIFWIFVCWEFVCTFGSKMSFTSKGGRFYEENFSVI